MAAEVDENLLTKLAAILPGGTEIQEGRITELTGQTRVWFRRSAEDTELYVDGTDGLTTTEFDVEVHSTDIAEAQALAKLLKRNAANGGLNGLRGAFGNMEVCGVFVSDQDDSYLPKGLNADEGFFIPAMKVTVIFDGSQV